MQLLIDFFPIIAFFVAYRMYDMYVATAVLIAAMIVQIGYQWLRHRTVNKMLLISGGLAIVLGGVTLALRNPLFLQWKYTIVNWLFGAAFLGSMFIGTKTLTERMMGQALELAPAFWRQLNVMWVVYFFVLGAVNLFVAYRFDESTWVNFKLFGTLGFTIVMVIGQAIWISSRTSRSSPEKGQ